MVVLWQATGKRMHLGERKEDKINEKKEIIKHRLIIS